YTMQMLTSMNMISMIFTMMIMSRASMDRIAELLAEVPDIRAEGKDLEQVPDGSIDFNHVSFSYTGNKEKESLKDIDLHIKSGETIGIIGSTGSGKSTLVQMIP